MSGWRRFLRPSLRQLHAYDVPPTTAPSVLNANECSELWSADVRRALGEVIESMALNRYPDTSGRRLRAVLGGIYGCDADRVVLGCGSDEVISILALAFSGGDARAMLVPEPSFVMYGHAAALHGFDLRSVPLDENFELDPNAMRSALSDKNVALCFLARPNNPTSTLWDAALIKALIAEYPDTLFVVDEAYGEYAPGTSLWRADGPPNYIYMSTLSKRGLAAIRVGYCIASLEIAQELNKVRAPYNVSATSLALAEVMLTKFAKEMQAVSESVRQQRRVLESIIDRWNDTRRFPAHGNLVLVDVGDAHRAQRIVAELARRGVVVKYAGGFPRLRDHIRISVGTAQDHARLENALDELGELRSAPLES